MASDVIEDLAYGDVALPATLVARQSFAADFVIPAPRLGPPTAHLGSALVAWAVYARWDIPYGGDERLAAPVEVVPHPAHFRAVVAGSLAPGSLHDAWAVGDATLAVHPLPPAVPGGTIDVSIAWPGAGTGRGARVELQAHVRAPNDLAGLVLDSIAVDPAALRAGTTVRLSVPPDAPPSLALDGIGIEYRVRALVDRPFRPDLAVERPIAVAGLHGGESQLSGRP